MIVSVLQNSVPNGLYGFDALAVRLQLKFTRPDSAMQSKWDCFRGLEITKCRKIYL